MTEGDLKELRELVEFLKASGVAEFDMERPELKVRLSFSRAADAAPVAAAPSGSLDIAQLAAFMAAGNAAAAAAGSAAPVEVAPIQGAVATPAATAMASAAGAPEADEDAGLHIIKSPLVGTFYESPSPGAEAFSKIGDRIAAGKVLCIVEAMKIMNEIESDAAGEIVKIYAKAGQPVEYGQKLFGLRT